MNIKKLFTQDPEKKRYASLARRSFASAIDIFIVAAIRVTTIQILGLFWINREMIKFQSDFKNTFGTEMPKDTPEHLQFIFHHSLVIQGLLLLSIIIFIGAAYHAVLNSSSWQATIGKRLMGIILVKKKREEKIGFWQALLHYFLSIAPFIFITYLVILEFKTKLPLVQLVSESGINLLLTIIFMLWLQPHLFTKKKTTTYDMICGTIAIRKKTAAKFPWSEN